MMREGDIERIAKNGEIDALSSAARRTLSKAANLLERAANDCNVFSETDLDIFTNLLDESVERIEEARAFNQAARERVAKL